MNTIHLENTTALIPGASRPIGRAIARKFATAGASLILPYFDWPDSVEQMKDEFSNLETSHLITKCDLRDKQQISALLSHCEEKFNTIDFLINNIERGGMPVIHGTYEHEHNMEQWELEFETTLNAKWKLYQQFLPMLKKSQRGAVVNISSISAIVGRSGPSSLIFSEGYSAANKAIASFTETWARQGAPNVRVNEIMLGLVNSRHGEGTRGWAEMTQTEKDNLINHTLLGRTATVEEVADLVFFLSCEATYITGSVIRMDGGYTLASERVPAEYPEGILHL